jgi:polyisoprenoid-binding protein YceI
MKYKIYIILFILIDVAGSANALTKPFSFAINPAESSIKFETTEGGSAIKGEFKKFTADIKFHPENLQESKVKVTIEMGSFAVNNEEAKGALGDPEWFNLAAFPSAVFESSSFKSLGDKRYEASGNLSIKGHNEPITLTFTLDEFDPNSAAITGEATLKRQPFALGDLKSDSANNDVRVLVRINASGVIK